MHLVLNALLLRFDGLCIHCRCLSYTKNKLYIMKLPYSFNLRNTFQLGSIQRNPLHLIMGIQRNPIRITCTLVQKRSCYGFSASYLEVIDLLKQLDSKNKELRAKDSKILDLNQQLEAKDSKILDLNQQLKAKDLKLLDLHQQLEAKNKGLISKNLKYLDLVMEFNALCSENLELERGRKALVSALDDLRESLMSYPILLA